jgi:hypothetical protein
MFTHIKTSPPPPYIQLLEVRGAPESSFKAKLQSFFGFVRGGGIIFLEGGGGGAKIKWGVEEPLFRGKPWGDRHLQHLELQITALVHGIRAAWNLRNIVFAEFWHLWVMFQSPQGITTTTTTPLKKHPRR